MPEQWLERSKDELSKNRFEQNFMQEQLARACDVTRQTIIALEAGKYSPSLELAFKISRALGRNLDEVFQYSE